MPSQPPTQQSLTLDLLLHLLSTTIFTPFLSALLPLCLRALGSPTNSPSFILTTTFATLVSLSHILAAANRRVAYGKRRKVRWEDEVVVVTGGKGGLGAVVAEVLGLRGVGVGVLDLSGDEGKGEGTGEEGGVRHYRCDVGDYEQVEAVWARVVKELGTPTILVNNAAVVHAGSFLTQTQKDIEETFRVNTLSHYHLNRLFVQGLLARKKSGCIVTISSVLGHLGAAHLSAYTASKAALLAYHSSLAAELATIAPQIRTILVKPGQLDTHLFGYVKLHGWWRNFFGPVLGAGDVAVRIVQMLDTGEAGVLSEPAYARWIEWLGILPVGLQRVVRGWTGVDMQFRQQTESFVSDRKTESSDSSEVSSDDESS